MFSYKMVGLYKFYISEVTLSSVYGMQPPQCWVPSLWFLGCKWVLCWWAVVFLNNPKMIIIFPHPATTANIIIIENYGNIGKTCLFSWVKIPIEICRIIIVLLLLGMKINAQNKQCQEFLCGFSQTQSLFPWCLCFHLMPF